MNFKHILAALSLVALFASCDRRVEFQSSKFITLDHYAYSVNETTPEVSIPVHIYNPDQSEVQVTVSVIESTAKTGTDFEVTSPASGILTFGPNDSTQVVKVQIKGQTGTYTGNKSFAIQVASATEGVTVGNTNVAAVTIIDLDHPLSSILGDYTATGLVATAGGQAQWDVTLSANEESISKVNVYNLSWCEETLVGEVSEDMTVITIPFGQMYVASGYATMFCGYGEGGYYAPAGNLILTKTETGWVQSTDIDDAEMTWGIGCLATSDGSPLGWLDYMLPGIVLTDK